MGLVWILWTLSWWILWIWIPLQIWILLWLKEEKDCNTCKHLYKCTTPLCRTFVLTKSTKDVLRTTTCAHSLSFQAVPTCYPAVIKYLLICVEDKLKLFSLLNKSTCIISVFLYMLA